MTNARGIFEGKSAYCNHFHENKAVCFLITEWILSNGLWRKMVEWNESAEGNFKMKENRDAMNHLKPSATCMYNLFRQWQLCCVFSQIVCNYFVRFSEWTEFIFQNSTNKFIFEMEKCFLCIRKWIFKAVFPLTVHFLPLYVICVWKNYKVINFP
jgi:hypothetical protein